MFKPFLACTLAGAAAFVFMGLQTGMFGPNRGRKAESDAASTAVAEKKPATPRAKFPDDLAPAARAKPVEAAAEFRPANKPHKIIFLKVNGAPHAWQEEAVGFSEDWVATNVEETELAIIVGKQSKRVVDTIGFKNGPPVERVEWECEVSIVEAKTGRVLAHRSFINRPRAIRNMEAFALTSLGAPVRYLTVFEWVSAQARQGFPANPEQPPFVTTVERQ